MKKVMLDSVDKKILRALVKNAKTPFIEIAKNMDISAGTVHVRFKKLVESGIVKGSTIILDYEKLGFGFVFYMTVKVSSTKMVNQVVEKIHDICNVTVANIVTGKTSIVSKIRSKDTHQAKDIIFKIGNLDGVEETEVLVSLDEAINDKNRLMEYVFKN